MKPNLIDHAQFRATAGKGGNGGITFRREKYVPKGGPDGGDGGLGGSVILRANPQIATLRFFAGKDRFEADKGGSGTKRQRIGEDAEDLVIDVPVGTIVYVDRREPQLLQGRRFYGQDWENLIQSGFKLDKLPYHDLNDRFDIEQATYLEEDWLQVADLSEAGQEVVIARGGRGGYGNEHYKSSVLTTPRFAQKGEAGESFMVRLELKVLADIGLAGLPNAGKSTLLSVLTKAKPEIADYPFTTLAPNLGVLPADTAGAKNLIIADIPGLIEDAHQGKGLGHDFLRHLERCQLIVYVVSPTEQDMLLTEPADIADSLWKQYRTVRHELHQYQDALGGKPSLVVINKLDLLIPEVEVAIKDRFAKEGTDTQLISAATHVGLEDLAQLLRSAA